MRIVQQRKRQVDSERFNNRGRLFIFGVLREREREAGRGRGRGRGRERMKRAGKRDKEYENTKSNINCIGVAFEHID